MLLELSDSVHKFIERSEWTFAKSYAETWPHEYIVMEKVDNKLFLELANHIDKFGHAERFYQKSVTYFHYDGYAYWHMDNIINRCKLESTYEERLKNGTLPETKK